MELFGIPLALDIGTFLSVLIAAGATRWFAALWRAEARAAKEAEEKRVRDAKLAEEKRARDDQLAAEERADKYAMHKEALEIHGSLTSLEVYRAAEHGGIGQAEKNFLLATYRRASSRYEAFKDTVELDKSLEDLVTTSLESIAALFPAELGTEQAKVEEKRIRRSDDRTKYTVGGDGPYSKHHTLHVIERRFCETHQITTRSEFEDRFGALVVEILGAELGTSRFNAKKLLKDPDAVTAKAKAKYGPHDQKLIENLGAIVLDGVDYIANFDAGFAPQPARIGLTVQRPLIDQLIVKLGYDDITVRA